MISEGLAVQGAIQYTSRVMNSVQKHPATAAGNSLTDIASQARVEPIAMVDADCANLEYISEVVQSLHAIFTGYYLQAVNLAGTINGVTFAEKLAPFNPRRGAFESFKDAITADQSRLSPLTYRLPLSTHAAIPALEALQPEPGPFSHLEKARKERLLREKIAEAKAVEKAKAEQRAAEKDKDRQQRLEDQETRDAKLAAEKDKERARAAAEKAEKDAKMSGMSTDARVLDSITESANLSVGKLFTVEIREGDVAVKIPVSVRLLVNIIPVQSMIDLFTFRDSFDLDMKERWHAWRSGRLSFWKDLVLCNDLIDKYRSAAIKDKSGLTADILNREAGHIVSSLYDQKASFATATNLAVMSEETMGQIEARLNGKFDNKHIRDSVFQNTNLMILAVIDKHWERVTFYHRGLATASKLSLKEIKAGNKGSGPDVTDIMKAYMLGNAPQF
jgi:hypothetical protein